MKTKWACALTLFVASMPVRGKQPPGEKGLDFVLTSGAPSKPYILESMSGGLGFLDYDQDGWIDVYLVNGSTIEAERDGNNQASDRLFRNLGDGTFEDVTVEAGLGSTSWGMGVAAADVDNNGYPDLYLTNYGPNQLYLNNGDGTFRDASESSGAAGQEWSSSAALADYDRDGDLDLYVSNYLEFDVHNLPKDSKLCRYRGIPVQCGPRGMTPTADRFYENRGGGRFVDVTRESGIGDVEDSFGLGVIWSDYDGDGDQDLYVANDSLPNFLFENNGDKTFTEIGLFSGASLAADGREQAGMGVDFGDYDNDGDFDLIVTNFSDDHNTLYRNDGGEFSDVSYEAGLGESTWPDLSWGVQFVDLNLDGRLDVAIANGHVYPEVDDHDLGTSYRQRDKLLINQGDGTWSVSEKIPPPGSSNQSSRGLAVADADNNGAMDLLIAHLDAPPALIMGPEPNANWIMIRLRGTMSNRDAVGAGVTVRAGQLSQVREVRAGGSYQSVSDPRLHFGLGESGRIDAVEIRWPSGHVQTLGPVEARQILTIEEPDAKDATGEK